MTKLDCTLTLYFLYTCVQMFGPFWDRLLFFKQLVPNVNNNWVKIVRFNKLWEIVFYAVTWVVCMSGQVTIFFFNCKCQNEMLVMVFCPTLGAWYLKSNAYGFFFFLNLSFHLLFSRFFCILVNALVKKFRIFPSTEKMFAPLQKKIKT